MSWPGDQTDVTNTTIKPNIGFMKLSKKMHLHGIKHANKSSEGKTNSKYGLHFNLCKRWIVNEYFTNIIVIQSHVHCCKIGLNIINCWSKNKKKYCGLSPSHAVPMAQVSLTFYVGINTSDQQQFFCNKINWNNNALDWLTTLLPLLSRRSQG